VASPSTAKTGDSARIYHFPGPAAVPAQTPAEHGSTARAQIIAALREAGPTGLPAGELEKRIDASKQRMYQVLPGLMDDRVVAKNADGAYVLADHAVSVG
jgi:predicted transcriptional regulator